MKSSIFYSFVLILAGPVIHSQGQDRYSQIVKADKPVAWWKFEAPQDGAFLDQSGSGLHARIQGVVAAKQAGPRPSDYPDFSPKNQAIRIDRGKNYLVVQDPGADSVLDFKAGDGITLEAWVKIDDPLSGSYPYIIGKGRTNNPGTHRNNQSYSLRLATAGGKTALSFFFVDPTGLTKHIHEAGHRWTSNASVPADGYWHHVAVTYTFGQEKSLRGYIDGKAVPGKWDLAGDTTAGPIVDDDELWIGSSVGGGATLGASLDEVAIYRTALSPEAIKKHAKVDIKVDHFAFEEIDGDLPSDHVQVDILETVSAGRSWKFLNKEMSPLYQTDLFALDRLPQKYNNKGLIIDRPAPSLIRLSSTVEFDAGEYEFRIRSLDASRLYIDGKLIAETEFMNPRADAHQEYYRLTQYGDEILSLAAGQLEDHQKVVLTAGKHNVVVYRLVGNKGKGNYLGEFNVGYAKTGEQLKFLAPERDLDYTDEGWLTFKNEERQRLIDWNQRERLAISQAEQKYWQQRHAWAKTQAGPEIDVPEIQDAPSLKSNLDKFIFASLQKEELKPTGQISDSEFLRRVSLDTIGTIPSPKLIQEFFELPKETRRAEIIEKLLNDQGWADHWVGYWQDVLAENPGLTKPELNNSGPFRWYLYESFLDNKPFDRFVTELSLMEGSKYSGGPAGFSVASQNDVPMAAKAHILGTAFLAVEMKCARCHDAPYHDVKQEDLFSIAALLKRDAQKVPGSSTIPLSTEEVASLSVKVTLQPGSSVKPKWPFAQFVSATDADHPVLAEEFVRNANDSRHQLAAMLTSPHNKRFSQVIVNRVWAKLIGRGIVQPVDDWEEAEISHPELLDYLSREFILSGYDLKALTRTILLSDIYQRAPVPGLLADNIGAEKFRGPIRRKMTGEQLADSLYAATGKSFGSEKLTMDADGKRPDSIFVHLGTPERAWQLITVSNERDRPSMSIPVAQSIIDLMSAYGWRQQRQEPLTHREDPLTALQPMALANGTSSLKAIDFSDDSALTHEALQDQPVEVFVEHLFERLLTRTPTSNEREMFSGQLRKGYETRIVAGPEAVPPKRMFRSGITWINHFHPDADREAMDRSREILEGDPKSVRLDPDWRQRAEDVVWVLVNSPEFVFVP
ncbi:hypothetical protein Mal48_25050 [Thalassoglobus polymorphus]|uniref:LamG-like jellyroll fold domain-containing protein n=2 Tax=Thalassoglobus polymorphus TaxID=2527994 RepID=A0A517QNT0_9PLAN|nr:hypothetical protein Mal48_25050 [Thalassoglobus polymorphus]